MATAKVAYYSVGLKGNDGSNVLGDCIYSEVLDFTSGADTTATALSLAMAQNRDMVARITAIDAACNYAVGATPDPDATSQTSVTGAGDYLASGQTEVIVLPLGAKVAVKAPA